MNRKKEDYVLSLLDNVKRLVVARSVVDEFDPCSETGESIDEEILSTFLTCLMISLGYRIPDHIYSLPNYSEFIDWLGCKEENGDQKWEDG